MLKFNQGEIPLTSPKSSRLDMSPDEPPPTVEYDPFIKSQLASLDTYLMYL